MLDDPLGLIVQGIAVLAAGMYPLGFLLGGCRRGCCCQIPDDGGSAEVVYFSSPGTLLSLNGDSFPLCQTGAAPQKDGVFPLPTAEHNPPPEIITGQFTFGTEDGCGGFRRCNCTMAFSFWRNLHSDCNGGSDEDIITQTVEVACTSGYVIVRTSEGNYRIEANESFIFDTIEFIPLNGTVQDFNGESFQVKYPADEEAAEEAASFSVTATLYWETETDHDLYGLVTH